MKGKKQLRIFSICIGVLVLVILIASAPIKTLGAPSTITVNSLSDDGGSCSVSKCTLRQAINDAISGDTINFGSLNGTIVLGSELTIDKDLIIHDTTKPYITISGDDWTRIFNVGYHDSLTLHNLILTHGWSYGGVVWNQQGYVTIESCRIEYNGASFTSVGPLYNLGGGTMDINRSTFTGNQGGNGGAINNSGSLRVTNSTFENNQASNYGGAIYDNLSSGLTVENSTFTGNSTVNYDGGAIYSDSHDPVNITNSTFYNNTAGSDGGAIFQETQVFGDDYMTITNSTISENSASTGTYGAGVVSFGYLKIVNSILVNSAGGNDCYWNFGGGGIFIRNLITNNAPSPHGCGTPYLTGGPMLLPLADNGGYTDTMALLTGSPAIDVGDADHCPSTDQRGFPRPQGGGCDLGAYELDSYPTVISSVTADPNPTSGGQVRFTVTFNEPVTGVDITDFYLTTTGSMSGAHVLEVTGSDDVYSVKIRTGSGPGTARLDIDDDDTIIDDQSNPLGGAGAGNGDFTSGEAYIVGYSYIYLPLLIR